MACDLVRSRPTEYRDTKGYPLRIKTHWASLHCTSSALWRKCASTKALVVHCAIWCEFSLCYRGSTAVLSWRIIRYRGNVGQMTPRIRQYAFAFLLAALPCFAESGYVNVLVEDAHQHPVRLVEIGIEKACPWPDSRTATRGAIVLATPIASLQEAEPKAAWPWRMKSSSRRLTRGRRCPATVGRELH